MLNWMLYPSFLLLNLLNRFNFLNNHLQMSVTIIHSTNCDTLIIGGTVIIMVNNENFELSAWGMELMFTKKR